MTRWRGLVRALAPPVVVDAARRLREGPSGEWTVAPEGFRRPVRGWDVASVAAAQVARWPGFLESIRAPRPLAATHESATADSAPSRPATLPRLKIAPIFAGVSPSERVIKRI